MRVVILIRLNQILMPVISEGLAVKDDSLYPLVEGWGS